MTAIDDGGLAKHREPLKGEGEVKIVRRVRTRVECEQCGEPADFRYTYLLPNARSNPASKAYGKDDCSWCSDAETFGCQACYGDREPLMEGYRWCSTFTAGPRFAHMFLVWRETVIGDDEAFLAARKQPA